MTFIFEFTLEKALLSHLTEFLLELGWGFSFVANQQRIKIGSEYYYPDLVFYNRLAKCFVIIDLKMLQFCDLNTNKTNTLYGLILIKLHIFIEKMGYFW